MNVHERAANTIADSVPAAAILPILLIHLDFTDQFFHNLQFPYNPQRNHAPPFPTEFSLFFTSYSSKLIFSYTLTNNQTRKPVKTYPLEFR